MQATLEYTMALAANADRWVPAHRGTEQPFVSRSGIRMLYCFNPRQQNHAYINADTDTLMSFEEAQAALMI